MLISLRSSPKKNKHTNINLIPFRWFNHPTYLRLIQTMILIIISFTLLSFLLLKYDVYKRSGSLYRCWLLIIYVSDEETNTLHTLMIYGSDQTKNACIVFKREYEGYQRSGSSCRGWLYCQPLPFKVYQRSRSLLVVSYIVGHYRLRFIKEVVPFWWLVVLSAITV
jgi:hypothetical protein